jgi:hypothetical protein
LESAIDVVTLRRQVVVAVLLDKFFQANQMMDEEAVHDSVEKVSKGTRQPDSRVPPCLQLPVLPKTLE